VRVADASEQQAAAGSAAGGGSQKALAGGPVLLAAADTKALLSQELKSGKDLIQTPFGNLPTISEKVRGVGWAAWGKAPGCVRLWPRGGGGAAGLGTQDRWQAARLSVAPTSHKRCT
jgi:hypothetical protein